MPANERAVRIRINIRHVHVLITPGIGSDTVRVTADLQWLTVLVADTDATQEGLNQRISSVSAPLYDLRRSFYFAVVAKESSNS